MTEKPWENEPDELYFVEHGLPCQILRIKPLGHLCGYIGVPPGHRMHGYRYSGYEALPDLRVHGGLTYSNSKPQTDFQREYPGYTWFGFDCAHLGDIVPGMLEVHGRYSEGTYKTIRFVEMELRDLARQIKEVCG